MGFRNKPPLRDFAAKLERLPKRSTTWFSCGKYDRACCSPCAKVGRVFGLPLVNGGVSQHMHVPYFPIPFSPGMLDGVADETEPFLLPRFELEDGPVPHAARVLSRRRSQRTGAAPRSAAIARQSWIAWVGMAPKPDDRVAVTTTYVFEPGCDHANGRLHRQAAAEREKRCDGLRLAFG